MTLPGGQVKGFLLDITGVLYNSGPSGGQVIGGSVEAIVRGKQSAIRQQRVHFDARKTVGEVAAFGLRHQVGRSVHSGARCCGVCEQTETATAPAGPQRSTSFNSALLGIVDDFASCDRQNPNCVVVGDAENNFNYENMNAAFRVLLNSERPLLVSLGCGRFYQRVDGPVMDLGGFAKALVYASDCEHVIIGKPQKSYFMHAVESLGLTAAEVVMIGDDIASDVAGAQEHGIRAVQVRTGKWRSEWEDHYVKPDLIADDLLSAVTTILNSQNVSK
ncbi:hypothetical protein M3Y98_00722800 [Aphelenchoides besseyi]|nr:hypothetical protein M3Y98_00722800 [Aphelenchoides besseyi]KAI6210218.1 hypothetical protein M3Y96_00304500 [Aphelenchoides besseyi]